MDIWTHSTELKDRHIGTFIKAIKTLWQMMGDQKKKIFLVFCLTLTLNTLGISTIYILKIIFDGLAIHSVGAFFSACILGYCAVQIIWAAMDYFVKESHFIRATVKLENKWPLQVQEKMLSLSLQYHEQQNTGEKIKRITEGCQRLSEVMGLVFWGILPELVFLLANIILIMVIDWRLGLVFMAPFIPAAIIQRKAQLKYTPMWQKYSIKQESAAGIFCESLLNISTIQGLAQEEKEKARLASAHKELSELDVKTSLAMQKYLFLVSIMLKIFLAATIFLGGLFFDRGMATVGTIFFIAMVGGYTSQNLRNIMNNYSKVVRYTVSVLRMKELLDTEIDIQDSPDAIIPQDIKYRLAQNHVSFTYKGKEAPVLNNVSIRVNPGEFIGLVGSSGAGKTTLIRLLNRMYQATTGIIMLDNYDIRKLKIHWYRQLFAPVPQEVHVFDESIRYNIAYGADNVTDEEVIAALRASHLDEVIDSSKRFPKGILTEVGDRGEKLSGGEKQRLGLARAYVPLMRGTAKFLILDEATSQVDSETEKAIQEMLAEKRKEFGFSIIAIAHRLFTIKGADRIYVLEDAKIVEQGTHLELLEKKGRYHELVSLQKLT